MSKSGLLTSKTIDKKDGARQSNGASVLRLQCPVCAHGLEMHGSPDSSCLACGFVVSEVNGIFRCLTVDRERHFRQFIREYELVRAKEGRGSPSSDYYLALPFEDLTGRNAWQWRIRAKTWHHMATSLLPEIERFHPQGCDVLDVGAGNCWLSYRMALRGHRSVAIDLLDNDDDGLGSARHYWPCLSQPFLRFQAEMDRLPFAREQFDVVIFNASFHYSADYEQTLSEALHCLRRPGHVIIADSPFYSCDEIGRQMVAEKHGDFKQRFGFRSDSIASREYLTEEVLTELTARLQVRWNVLKPWYGISWALRPVKARLWRRREPAKFYLLWGKVQS